MVICHCKVCKKWNFLASDNKLWSNLFKERWGEDRAAFYEPDGSKSWKDVYEVQDRGDRVGLGLKIIREGGDYYLVHQGEIHQYLGSRRQRKGTDSCPLNSKGKLVGDESLKGEKPSQGILDQMLFFIGDLEVASTDAKRGRVR
ncbi:hypothetical protein OIU77_008462 [Salix suchowensis]|uniref:Uncharacterized protein n=1 Tax=Salix suchowensis TaxID=1278906 RepID=A0ABQ9AJL4_9ROSI|nr:hypothetical protein OIU77_008462 [Salix suchowensis]